MRKFAFLPLIALIGCTTINSTSRQEKERVEVSMHKIRTDLEEIKHDLNTHQMELHILEGKLINQEDQVTSIKGDTIDQHDQSISSLQEQVQSLEKKVSRFEKKQIEMVNDLKTLEKNAKDIHFALSRYKNKFAELEQVMEKQHKALEQMRKVKDDLTSLLSPSKTYTVKTGDSLEKIAKKFHVELQNLKKANHIQSDLIMAGQELVIPEK